MLDIVCWLLRWHSHLLGLGAIARELLLLNCNKTKLLLLMSNVWAKNNKSNTLCNCIRNKISDTVDFMIEKLSINLNWMTLWFRITTNEQIIIRQNHWAWIMEIMLPLNFIIGKLTDCSKIWFHLLVFLFWVNFWKRTCNTLAIIHLGSKKKVNICKTLILTLTTH